MNGMAQYAQLAAEFCAAIKKLATNEKAIDNFEGYLSYHFPVWMEKFAGYPEGLTSEMQEFAKMFD